MNLHLAIEISEQLAMLDPVNTLPSDLPGRFGRVVRDVERLLGACGCESSVAGGWSVWHYGYIGRVTHDLDIVIAEQDEKRLQELAPMFGFRVLAVREGNWPKLEHKETSIEVDMMPEGRYPGVPSNLGPIPLRHPRDYRSTNETLPYVSLTGLFELKLGAWRVKDQADLIELIKVNSEYVETIRKHLSTIHPILLSRFETLLQIATAESS